MDAIRLIQAGYTNVIAMGGLFAKIVDNVVALKPLSEGEEFYKPMVLIFHKNWKN